jgi:uncharacterized protein (DUF58 family)
MIRGLAPQPRLLWAVGIGAGLIALAIVSPVLGFVAVVYNAGLVIIAARDLALLPGRAGYLVHRVRPEPFSLGELEEVTVVVENPAAALLNARVADHAPADLKPEPREMAGRFDVTGRLDLSYPFSPKRGAYRFGPVDLQVWRDGGWWRRQVRLVHPDGWRSFPAWSRSSASAHLAPRPAGDGWDAPRSPARCVRRSRAFAACEAMTHPPRGLDGYLAAIPAWSSRWRAERGQNVMIAIDCGRLMTAPAELDKLDHAVNAA